MARLIACALAATALAALVLLGVLNGIAVSRGEESFGVLGFAFLALGVLAPVCVGLFLLLQRPRTLVAWILVAGGSSVVVVMAAYGVSAAPWRRTPAPRSAPGRCSSPRSGSCCSRGRSRSPTVSGRTAAVPALAAGRGVALASCGGAMLLLLAQETLEGPYGEVHEPASAASRTGRWSSSSGSAGPAC